MFDEVRKAVGCIGGFTAGSVQKIALPCVDIVDIVASDTAFFAIG